jgi:hypothetical protein
VLVNFEDDLRDALRREPAPGDFTAKVLAAAAQQPSVHKRGVAAFPFWRRPAAWAVAAGLAAAAMLPPAVLEYRHREEQRALEAKHELLFALSITRAKLRQTRERVHRATARHTL